MATALHSRNHSKNHTRNTSVQLDMTPMVDLAFLLVTFFMLTTKFASDASLAIQLPKSTAFSIEPENLLTILVAKDGRVFYELENQVERAKLLQQIGKRYGISFSEAQINTFSKMGPFGMDVRQLASYLSLTTEDRKQTIQSGIPVKTTDNQLANWLMEGRMLNPRLRFAIKCDAAVHYPLVKQIIGTLQDHGISRFGLVTEMERQ